MARRNKATRVQRNRPAGSSGAAGNPRETAEDAAQRKSFFVWTAVITAVVVLLIYFLLFD